MKQSWLHLYNELISLESYLRKNATLGDVLSMVIPWRIELQLPG